MIKKLSEIIANWITKDLELDSKKIAAVKYGLESILGAVTETIAVFLFALSVGALKYAVFIMIPPFFYRMLADGPHCSSYKRCFVVTFCMYSISALFCKSILPYINTYIIFTMLSISLLSFVVSYRSNIVKNVKATIAYLAALVISFSLCWIFNIYKDLVFAGVFGLTLQSLISNPIGYKLINSIDSSLKNLNID